ncbi:MAG: hypothetical protein MZV64_31220 [Ignavibacteriales bacterium]|nr:hypothetical protein [Ignavibacteriales bacterium]
MGAIKIGYVVATPELRFDEGVTAYQEKMEEAFRRLSNLGMIGADLMIRYPDCIEKGLFERFSRDYESG